jgi:hypothetical protein
MLDTENLLILGGLAAAALVWADAARARETALRHARRLCEGVGAQLLDESVALARLSLARAPEGSLGLRRLYRFEFSLAGYERRGGSIALLGRRLERSTLDLPDGELIEE